MHTKTYRVELSEDQAEILEEVSRLFCLSPESCIAMVVLKANLDYTRDKNAEELRLQALARTQTEQATIQYKED